MMQWNRARQWPRGAPADTGNAQPYPGAAKRKPRFSTTRRRKYPGLESSGHSCTLAAMPATACKLTPPPEVWIDGGFFPAHSAALPACDQAYLSGMGAFETMRAERGDPLFLDAHLDRLRDSAAMFALDVPDADTLRNAVRQLLARQGILEARVRITVSGSLPPDGAPLHIGGHARTSLLAFPLQPAIATPLHIITAPQRIDATSPLAGHKCTSYALHALALHHARAHGGGEALMLNHHGELVSGAVSNLFWVKDGRVFTPDTRCGCRPGVTRQRVLDACADLDIPCTTVRAHPTELARADEVFMTSAIRGIHPVDRLDGSPHHPGPVTRNLRAAMESE